MKTKYATGYALTAWFFCLLLSGALAAPTDGQYTLISYSTTASGETTDKSAGYSTFASTGETLQAQGAADFNLSAGLGFLGEPLQKKTFPEVVAEAAADIYVIMVPDNQTQNIFLFVFMAIVGMLALIFLWHKKTKSKEEGEVE